MTKGTQDDVANRINALEAKLGSILSQVNTISGGTTRYASDGVNLYNYMYRDSIIYHDVFNAYNSNIFVKKGTPGSWDETSYVTNPWNQRRILRIGLGPQSNGNGMMVNVPQGYNVLWLRVLNDRWQTFRVQPAASENQVNFNDVPEIYAAGYRNLNEIAPDGAGPDSYWNVHTWMPVPLRQEGPYMVYADKNSDDWISGIAFSKNIWNHAMNSAVAYHWKLNPGTGDIGWNTHNWNNDQLAQFNAGSNCEVSVPVVPTGKDKILYIVEHNNNWTGTMHGKVWANGQEIERFRTSYNNPFAVHFNSKIYDRYMATRIPANVIGASDKFVRVKIDMTMSNHHIHFREMGTHDYM